MKNLIKTSVILLFLLTTVLSNAKDIPTLKDLNDGKTTMLTLLDVEQGNILIIKDLSGTAFYQEAIQSSGKFKKGFNLRLLVDGAYYFELNKYLEVKKIPFNVINNRVHYKKGKESTTAKTIVQPKGNYLLVSSPAEIKQKVEFEPRVHRRVLSFKGGDFIKYQNASKKVKSEDLK